MLKTKTWILIFSVVLLICLGAALFLGTMSTAGTVAEILQDGKCIRRIDLDAVRTPFTFVVTASTGGSNTVLVEPGRICVSDADCPDHICMHRGWISDGTAPIVCMPNRLVIRIRSTTQTDAAVG